MILNGCDISTFQVVDFPKLKNNVDFVIIKASEGVGFTDPKFVNNQIIARQNNLPLGYYHFARPDLGNSPETEADWFLKVVGKLQAGEILCLDFEVNYADPVGWCKKFLDYLASKTGGYKGLIYLNLALINGHDWSTVINADYGLWLAHYDFSSALTEKLPWATVAMKQYSSKGRLVGISGDVDVDVFYGDLTTFKAYGFQESDQGKSTITDDEQRSLQVLKDAFQHLQTLDGKPFGNLEGMTRELVDKWPRYSEMTGQVSLLNGQLETIKKQLVDATDKLVALSKAGNFTISNSPTIAASPPVVVFPKPQATEIPVPSNPFAKLLYQIALAIG